MRARHAALPLLVPVALLLAGFALAADGSAPGAVTVDPDPVPADAPFTVVFRPDADAEVERAILRVCLAEDGEAVFCRLPQEMRVTPDGAMTAQVPAIEEAGQQFGVNVTLRLADGRALTHPPGAHAPGTEYVFFTTAGAPDRGAPAPAALVAVAALALAAGAVRARRG